MTESDHYPDMVEDRVRRTFAARAENMATGAGDQGLRELLARPSAQGSGNHQDHGPGRFLLVAAIVVIVGAALAAIGVVAANGTGDPGEGTGDVAGDGDDDGSGVPVADLLAAQRSLVMAIQDERNLATVELIGQDDLLTLPIDDAGEARRRTDAAIAALRTVTDTDPAASAYRQVLDDLGGLAGLRGDIDANAAPRDMGNIAFANDVFDRYAQLVTGLLDAQEAIGPAIDDPEQRAGFELHRLGQRQEELTIQLARATLLNAVGTPSSGSLTDLSRLYDLVRQGQADLTAAAAGTPYEQATERVIGEIEDSGLLDVVEAALGGTTDIAALLASVELPLDQGWPPYLDRVEEILTTEG